MTARFAAPPAGLDGLAQLRAVRDGTLPAAPATLALGMRLGEVEPGRVVWELTPAEAHTNPLGIVHGGVISTLLDSAMACAIIATLPPGRGVTTLELKVSFHRAVTAATGPVRAIGTLLHAGRRVGTAEGRLLDAEDRLLASGSTTCLLLDLPA